MGLEILRSAFIRNRLRNRLTQQLVRGLHILRPNLKPEPAQSNRRAPIQTKKVFILQEAEDSRRLQRRSPYDRF